jgi:hypothetical protein
MAKDTLLPSRPQAQRKPQETVPRWSLSTALASVLKKGEGIYAWALAVRHCDLQRFACNQAAGGRRE